MAILNYFHLFFKVKLDEITDILKLLLYLAVVFFLVSFQFDAIVCHSLQWTGEMHRIFAMCVLVCLKPRGKMIFIFMSVAFGNVSKSDGKIQAITIDILKLCCF